MNKYLVAALAICAAALFVCAKRCSSVQQERDRLSDNQRSLMSNIEFYEAQSGQTAVSVERLLLTQGELRKLNASLTGEVEKLNVKIGHLQSVSRQVAQTSVSIAAPVVDTVFVNSATGAMDTLKSFRWRDDYVTVEGVISNDTATCSVTSVDTLMQVVHRVPRRFLFFFKCGTKAIRQEITSKNPHTRIVYAEYVEVI